MASNTVTISGTPTVSGTFNYTITLTGGCGAGTATGTITVTPNNTITWTSGSTTQTICINTAITPIIYSTTGATGATFAGLPNGVTGAWASNVSTISGTPTVSGTFSYTVTLTGGCGAGTATGTITVYPLPACSITGADQLCPFSAGNVYTAPAGMSSYLWTISGDGAINGPTNGSTVSITAGANCNSNFILSVTINDINLCSSSCSKTVSVKDITPPIIICTMPNIITVEANSGTTYIQSGTSWDATGSDNCGSVTITASLSGATSGSGYTTLNNVAFNEGTTTVTWTVTDACSNSVSCSFVVIVLASADLQITKTASPNPAITGQQLMYTIIVTNLGPATAKNVVITDNITAFPAPEYATNLAGPWSPWTSPYLVPGNINNGGTYTLYIRGVVSINQCSAVSNTASVTNSVNDPNPANNSVIITTNVLDNQPPTFIPPTLATGYCVEGFLQATYNPGGTYYVNDLTPARRDYYILTAGNNLLDLTNITDNCPGPITIAWTIDFGNNASIDLSGTGQISLATPINFPLGDNLITWVVTDAHGNSTTATTILKVVPRPDIQY